MRLIDRTNEGGSYRLGLARGPFIFAAACGRESLTFQLNLDRFNFFKVGAEVAGLLQEPDVQQACCLATYTNLDPLAAALDLADFLTYLEVQVTHVADAARRDRGGIWGWAGEVVDMDAPLG